MSAAPGTLVHMSELSVISADGTNLTAIDEGQGPVLLVVHPGGQGADMWDGVARLLAADFRVVRLRRRIYVDRAAVARSHSMATEAADILAVIRHLDCPVVLVGHSSGAVAALEAALREPSAPAGVIVYEPPMPTRELVAGEAGLRARTALDAGDEVEAMRIHMRDIVGMPGAEVDAMFDNPGTRAAFTWFAEAQIADDEAIDALGLGIGRYVALPVPVTLIEGDLSPVHLRERLADLADMLPAAQVVTLAGQGHIAHLTAPDLLAAAIREAAGKVFA